MSMNINTVTIVGRLTKDPIISKTQTGVSVCGFTLAVDRAGAKGKTDFIDCVTWRQSADFLGRFGHKGQECGIVGQLQTRTYDGRDGKPQKVTEVVGNIQLVNDGKRTIRNEVEEEYGFDTGEEMAVTSDDLPF